MTQWLAMVILMITAQDGVRIPRPPSHGGCVANVTPELKSQWHRLTDSHNVIVEVERGLYETKNNDRYYIHVRITNDSNSLVSVDLRDAHSSIFPNQWELSRRPFRGPIDEFRPGRTELTREREQELAEAHASHKLSEIAPHRSLDFYRESPAALDNAGGFADGCYLILSLAGELLFTDGRVSWKLDTDRLSSVIDNVIVNPAEMVMPLPITLVPLPEAAQVIHATPIL
jgi:hypothetical protein